MISYNDIYEILRKEKYSDVLQQLPKNFIEDFSLYLSETRNKSSSEQDLFADSLAKSKKQVENSIALFKELILRRKKKLLSLVFTATETGIMKRDYENMLSHEKQVFDKFVSAFEEGDKVLSQMLLGDKAKSGNIFKMVMINEGLDQFVSMDGSLIGPFSLGEVVNMDSKVAEILVSSGKASYIDE